MARDRGAILKMDRSSLIERVRALLVDEPSTREVSMFGGRSFMVNNAMLASAVANGDLLVRVAPGRHDELMAMPGAASAEMGVGRTMGPGWISVSSASIASEKRLSFWIRAALEHNHRTGKLRR